ncbi:MAG TPA: electron transporter RnfD, partial [Megasphaera sp.]|nr:electron transporter RnfD [Megasphaera sp.]
MSPEAKGQTIGKDAKDMQELNLTVSSSPHVRCNESIPKIMWNVVAALVPAAAFGVYYFGANALLNMVVAVVSAVIFEFLWEKALHKKVTITDGSAVITGLLLAMCCPPSLPWWMSIVGSFLAIVVCKQSMGGLGYNLFNPAHVGRAGLMVSWPIAMTTWTNMDGSAAVSAVGGPTPLNAFKHGGQDALFNAFNATDWGTIYQQMFFGMRSGSAGETCTVLLILGGLYLIARRIISWRIPVCYICSLALFVVLFGDHGFDIQYLAAHMFGGGLMLGAFFMATDYVTSPITPRGQIIFGVILGILTGLFRIFGGSSEGVSYAIIFSNLL